MESFFFNSLYPIDTSSSNSLCPLPPSDYFKDFDFISDNSGITNNKRVFDQEEVTQKSLSLNKGNEYESNQKELKQQEEAKEIIGMKGVQKITTTFQFTLDSTYTRNMKIRRSIYEKILEIPKEKRTFIMTESLNAPYIHFLLQREASGAPKRKYRRKMPSQARANA